MLNTECGKCGAIGPYDRMPVCLLCGHNNTIPTIVLPLAAKVVGSDPDEHDCQQNAEFVPYEYACDNCPGGVYRAEAAVCARCQEVLQVPGHLHPEAGEH
jgi:hypothetical protein